MDLVVTSCRMSLIVTTAYLTSQYCILARMHACPFQDVMHSPNEMPNDTNTDMYTDAL